MNFSIYNKFVEVALNWCASINCYNKTIIEKSFLWLPKDMFIKIEVMLQAAQLIICHPKLKIYENSRTDIPRNKRNMFIAITGRCIFRALSKIWDAVFGENSQQFQRRIQKGVKYLRWSFLRKRFSAVHYFSHSLFTQKAPF